MSAPALLGSAVPSLQQVVRTALAGAEQVAVAVDLERCSDFVIDPLARRRVVAAVCSRASAAMGRFERVQGRGRSSA